MRQLSHGVDTILAGIMLRSRLHRKRGGTGKFLARTIDLRKAYKQLPLSLEALPDAYICVWNPWQSRAELFQSLVLPFGAKPAVQGFCRTSAAVWFLGTHLFRFHWSVYFYDFVLVGHEVECNHLDQMQAGFFALLGWETSAEKDAGFSMTARALGVEICLAESHLGLARVQNSEARKRDIAGKITSVLEKGGATSKDFESLRGRLLFAEGQIFGRAACQRMKTLSSACKGAGFIRIKGDLGEALLFLRDRVVLGPPRTLKASDRVCVHLYTNASYDEDNAGVGGILYSNQGLMLHWFSESTSASCLDEVKQPDQKGFIYELEACASVLGVLKLCKTLRDCDIILFCDNEAALAALITCRSDSPVVAQHLLALTNFEDHSRCQIWFERVASASNPADAPSPSVGSLNEAFRIRFDLIASMLDVSCEDFGQRG